MTRTAWLNQTRLALFNTTAARYDERILPAFGPLARRLVEAARVRSADRVLDLGTGTGAVAFAAAKIAEHVAAVDYAGAMLQVARRKAGPSGGRVLFYQGDMHRLPHPDGWFTLALASFGFNGVDPATVFPEVRRILQPGGRLVFQEWGEMDDATRLVKQAVKAHRVPRAEGFLANLRLLATIPDAWDLLEDEEDVARLLRQSGFRQVDIVIQREAIPFEPLAFFHYKTAWTPYQAELAAMSPADRQAVRAEVVEQLSARAGPDGRFIWQPELARFFAYK